MKTILRLAAIGLLAACAPDEGDAAPGDSAAAAAPAEEAAPAPGESAETGRFVMMRGRDTLFVSRFTRTAARLEAQLTASGGERARYTAELNPDATVSRLEVVSPGGEAGGEQRVVVLLRGDTARVEQTEGGQTRAVAVPTEPGAIPTLRESIALVEQILRRARVVGGSQTTVPVLSISNNAQTARATVHFFAADSARVRIGETEIVAATDRAGRLLGARLPGQGLTVLRTP